jgi:hypothetical protein
MENIMNENNNHHNFEKLQDPTKRSINMPGFDQLPTTEKREIVRDEIRNILTKDRKTAKISFSTKLIFTSLTPILSSILLQAITNTNPSFTSGLIAAALMFGTLTAIDHVCSKKEKELAIQNDIKALQSKSGYVFSQEQIKNEVDVIKTELKNTPKNPTKINKQTMGMSNLGRYSGR